MEEETKELESFEIMTRRPEGMAYEDYKTYMRAQKKAIKKYLKGRLFHLSKLHPTKEVMNLLQEEEYKEMSSLLFKGRTYVKPKENESSN